MKVLLEKINRKRLNWLDSRCYIKNKVCVACKYFCWYIGPVGICEAKKGCPSNSMKDFMDTCDCGKFKKKNRRV